MPNSISRYFAFAILVVASLAQPAFARENYTGSHHADRYHRAYAASPDRHHYAYQGRHRHVYAARVQRHAPLYAMQTQNFSGFTAFAPSRSENRNQGQSRFASNRYSVQSSGLTSGYESLVAQQASANGIPASLVERVIKRESGGNPRAVSRGNYGLMQIRLGTARAMGYSGSAEGLLDAATNMTYAVRYLGGAYRAAGGNESRAVALYASGYGAHSVQRPTYQTAVWFTPAANSLQPSYVGSTRASHRVKRHWRHPV
jgi:soluble lytic murein transglycosylase-like protein